MFDEYYDCIQEQRKRLTELQSMTFQDREEYLINQNIKTLKIEKELSGRNINTRMTIERQIVLQKFYKRLINR
jgi:hypothetical protein